MTSDEAQLTPAPPPARLSPEEERLVADLVADGLSIQDKFRAEPLYKQTGKGQYDGGTVQELRQAKGQSQTKKKE